MMGYAERRDDLARGDELRGVLRTGDIGRCDDDGYFHLTGRLKRFIKLSGARVNLDEVEAMLTNAFGTHLACVGTDDSLAVVLGESAAVTDAGVRDFLRTHCDIYAGLVRVERQRSLPYTSSGKLDYQALMRLVL
jgi:acyl-coenzyme A synthetase/AMP-(fatty) acid ligase